MRSTTREHPYGVGVHRRRIGVRHRVRVEHVEHALRQGLRIGSEWVSPTASSRMPAMVARSTGVHVHSMAPYLGSGLRVKVPPSPRADCRLLR